MSLTTPKPPRRFWGKPARYMALRYRLDLARRARFDGAFLIHKATTGTNRAASAIEVIQAVSNALSLAPDPCKIYEVSADGFNLQVSVGDQITPLAVEHLETLIAQNQNRVTIDISQLPPPLQPFQAALVELGCKSAILLPIRKGGALAALFLIGFGVNKEPSAQALRIYQTVSEIAEIGLDKTLATQSAQRPMAELEAFNFISQAVAGQTELEELLPIIHKAISQILGQVDLLIALYDSQHQMIHIPYLYEHPNLLSVDPFPMGQGLTSILIRTGQALLLSKNVETQAREMGAIILGRAPKSWLGVPLIVAEEPIGALVVQDLEKEYRFNEDDQRLLTSLGAQIAISLFNAQLIEKSRQTARRERLLHEVTSKIRSSTDIKTILATTATELGRALQVKSAIIDVGIKQTMDIDGLGINSTGDKPKNELADSGERDLPYE